MEFLHTCPNTGLSYYSEEEPVTGLTTIRATQDVQPILDSAARQRQEGTRDKGIAGHIKKYCDLPFSVMLKLKTERGINMFRPSDDDFRKFFQVIETEYPLLKTTEMKGWRPK